MPRTLTETEQLFEPLQWSRHRGTQSLHLPGIAGDVYEAEPSDDCVGPLLRPAQSKLRLLRSTSMFVGNMVLYDADLIISAARHLTTFLKRAEP